MKIIIASTIVPFIEGGATFIVDWLDTILKKHGHQTEVLKIPFHSEHTEMLQQMLALRLMDVTASADMLIAIRTPSYLIRHPNKVLWFIHHHRGAYDLWGSQYQDIPDTDEGLQIRQSFIQADNLAFSESKRIFTNSKIVSDRLKRFNNVDSEVLYPPLMDADKYHCHEYGDYLFYPSRLTYHKRQELAIEAMKYTKSKVRLIVAGNPENSGYLQQMHQIIKSNKLQDKVRIIDRWISDEEKIDFYAKSLGCIYVPLDEDSYGYPSLEAYHSRKPVITCSDSGGTLELIEHGVNGFISSPDPKELASYFDQMFSQKDLAVTMGKAGYEKLAEMNISWENVVQRFAG
jgi:glycosyltransferase involved in cell wall biosynthesis